MKPSQVTQALTHLVRINQPAMLWGPPGVGKSDLVRQVGKTLKLEVRDIRLSLLDPTDIKGFPVPDTTKKVMHWLPANFIPTKGKGILFFDEINSAAPAVQAAAYQLILDRKVGDVTLPPGWAIIAAGNRASDRGVTHAMPSPLANRLVHIDVEADINDWYEWALGHGISAPTCAFLRFKPNLLHDFNPQANPRSFPSPRTWVFADRIRTADLPADVEYQLLCGAVGEGAATEYSAFVRLASSLPTVDQILLAPDSIEIDPDKPELMYALATSVETQTTPNNFDRLMQFINRLPPEYQVLYMRGVARNPTLTPVLSTAAFTQWAAKNSALLK